MKLIELKSPAKINLYLKVLQKKDDGYHNIETCFQYIDLYDHMSFENTENGISIESNNAFLEGSNNTIYQSAKILADIGDISSGVNIKIEKNIPIGAGLGGGSSNAASTIVALNKLWGLGLNKNKMLEIAKKIGADVPFFIYGDNAYGKGIGDTLEFKESIRDKILLIDPKINNSSAEMFELFDNFKQSNKNTSNYPQNDFWDVFLDGNFESLPKTVVFSAEFDPLADDGGKYCNHIRRSGGQAEWYLELGLVHGYLRARHHSKKARASFERIVEKIVEFKR